ncbi:hypothetical protein [Succinivibrio sp.]|uniref:hypothetical protein n=1 Tax=Succinivibrio sp. TaxID=2053619 RepID=UPI0025E741D9|nr:hypothetical protein [Succinivibrio sp.]MBQ9222089.1 hypothetical protein [Succinivibrio sp.]
MAEYLNCGNESFFDEVDSYYVDKSETLAVLNNSLNKRDDISVLLVPAVLENPSMPK